MYRIIRDSRPPAPQQNEEKAATIIFNEEDIEENFPLEELSAGLKLFNSNAVSVCQADHYEKKQGVQYITGRVTNLNRRGSYSVTLTATMHSVGERGIESEVILDGECNCNEMV